jgi:uncharacterized membrane protein
MTRTIFAAGWVFVAIGAILVAVVSSRYFLISFDLAAPPELLAAIAQRKFVFFLHICGGIVALALGAWNFVEASRRRFLILHRWLGRIYLISVLVGGVAGLLLATTAQGGLAGRIGFGLLAVLWLATGAMAYYRIRNYDIALHRQWMIRSYALTFAAVTLRIWIPILMGAGYEFQEAYAAIAWISWVPNLIVAEFLLRRNVEV